MDAATAAVLGLAAGTFVAACLANLFAYRTFREARKATAAQLNTLSEQQVATSLGRQAVQEAQRATEVAMSARREEQISRQIERLVGVAECLADVSRATVVTPMYERANACRIALRRLGPSLAAVSGIELPHTANLARFSVRDAQMDERPDVPQPESCEEAQMEVQDMVLELRDALRAIQRDGAR